MEGKFKLLSDIELEKLIKEKYENLENLKKEKRIRLKTTSQKQIGKYFKRKDRDMLEVFKVIAFDVYNQYYIVAGLTHGRDLYEYIEFTNNEYHYDLKDYIEITKEEYEEHLEEALRQAKDFCDSRVTYKGGN